MTASQAGNGNYNAAPDVTRSFTIAKASATISLSNLYYLYDGQPHGATATTNPAGLSGVSFSYVGTTLAYNSPAPPTAAGTYTVTASLANNNYAATPASATFVINAAPAVTITGPASGAIYTKGSTVSLTGTFVDNPSTHTAAWPFTSGTQTITQPATVNETTGAVSASYTFASTGVYTLKLTVTDNFSVVGEATTVNNVAGAPALIAVYDPSSTGGSVSTTTKSPLYNSLAGWYPSGPTLTGTATTGFNASYSSATATVPTGQAVFNFAAANLSFTSLSYQWMVVTKPYVWLRGAGTVNNVSGYEFLIAAVDGQLTGGGGTDKFRIRVWRKSDGVVIYDNMPGSSLNAVAVTTTSNGDIAIK
ncbi:MAG TPA: MBG domain-containing protein [Pyrinomonadaceae bacterium]|nr:MBG domain-containing protein [Pyrinomonadaceae bacterium]